MVQFRNVKFATTHIIIVLNEFETMFIMFVGSKEREKWMKFESKYCPAAIEKWRREWRTFRNSNINSDKSLPGPSFQNFRSIAAQPEMTMSLCFMRKAYRLIKIQSWSLISSDAYFKYSIYFVTATFHFGVSKKFDPFRTVKLDYIIHYSWNIFRVHDFPSHSHKRRIKSMHSLLYHTYKIRNLVKGHQKYEKCHCHNTKSKHIK